MRWLASCTISSNRFVEKIFILVTEFKIICSKYIKSCVFVYKKSAIQSIIDIYEGLSNSYILGIGKFFVNDSLRNFWSIFRELACLHATFHHWSYHNYLLYYHFLFYLYKYSSTVTIVQHSSTTILVQLRCELQATVEL